MAAVANNPSFAKKVGVSQSVGKDFSKADKGKTFKQGGDMKESKTMVKKEIGFMKAKGAPKSMVKHEMTEMKGAKKMASGGMAYAKGGSASSRADGIARKGKTQGTQVKMNRGGKC